MGRLWQGCGAYSTRRGGDISQAIRLIILSYVLWRLPFYLEHSGLFQRVSNWCTYRRWTACRPEHLRAVHTPVDMGGVVAVCEYVCEDCGIALMKDTKPQVRLTAEDHARIQREVEQNVRRDALRERLRVFLMRWVLPPVREYQRFCAAVGGFVVTVGLGLWLTWGWVGPTIDQGWRDTLRSCCETGACASVSSLPKPEEALP
jgi:hypothetical protein